MELQTVKKQNAIQKPEVQFQKKQDQSNMTKSPQKVIYTGPNWYDGKIVQWIFCNFIPFAFLAAYPLIIKSYYTILHIGLALIFIQITIYKFYIDQSQLNQVSPNSDDSLREKFIQKQVVKLRNFKSGFLSIVLVLEVLNIFSKTIFVIVYYAIGDLDTSSIEKILFDLEFFFVSTHAKESNMSEAKLILLTFIPNLLLFSVFGLAKKICKYEKEIRIEQFLVPSHQTTQGLLNFLVLVCLVGCQIFNPSIMAFGFLGFFLLQQINNLLVKNNRKFSTTNLKIQFLIQVYCYIQFIMIMFASTNTFEKYKYFDIEFLGFGAIANFIKQWTKQPFYVLSLSLLFIISVIYSQTLNYERQREISLKLYKQIENHKKKSKLKRALIKILRLSKFVENEGSKDQLETQSDKLPHMLHNESREKKKTVHQTEDIQIELASFNRIHTQQGMIEADKEHSLEIQNDNKNLKNFRLTHQEGSQKDLQSMSIFDQQQEKQISINDSPDSKNKSSPSKQIKKAFVFGEPKSIIGSEQILNNQDETNQQQPQNNQSYMIINNIRKNKKTNTLTLASTSKNEDDLQVKRESYKSKTISGNKQHKSKRKNYENKDREQEIQMIRKQLQQLEEEQSNDIDLNSIFKRDDYMKSEDQSQGDYLPSIRERSNKTVSLSDRISIWKHKLVNYILEQSQKLFIYIKQKFEDSIIPIRFLQCCSIFAIMRYPCYYSLGLIIWVLLNSIIKFEMTVKYLFITIVPIPCLITIYAFNLYGSIRENKYLYPKHGFVYQQYFWIECLLLNVLIFLFFTYLLILRHLSQNLNFIKQSNEALQQEKQNMPVCRNQSEQVFSLHPLSVISYSNKSNQNEDNHQNNSSGHQKQNSGFKLGGNEQMSPNKKNHENSPNIESPQKNAIRNPSKSDPTKEQIQTRFSMHNNKFKGEQVSYTGQGFFENPQQGFYHMTDQIQNSGEELNQNGKAPIQQKPLPLITIFFAVILKYSQTLALFLLYWIGFYTFNLVHLLLVLFFLVFFQNSMRTINIKKNGKIYEMSFSFKYWYWLLLYLALVILAKFIYTIVEQGMDYVGQETSDNNTQDSSLTSIFKFVGINYDYQLPFSLSLSKEDYAGLSIIWIAYMFATLQEDTYRSETYQKYSNKINFLIQDIPLIKKYSPNFLTIVNKLTIIIKNLLFWLSFFAITTCLILIDFSFANSVLLASSFFLVFYYIFKYKDPQIFSYEKYYKLWYIFNQVVIVYILLCYILQFTALQFVKDYIIDEQSQIYKVFNRNRAIYGVYSELQGDESLRFQFFPIIFVLYFAIYVQNYLKMISNAVEYHDYDQAHINVQTYNSALSYRVQKTKVSNDPRVMALNQEADITIDTINKNFQKMRREENRLIYNNYVLFDLFNEVGIDSILRALQFIMIDVMNFLVFLFAMIFRLSISMLIFIIIYLKFYYKYHHKLENFLEKKYMKKSIHYFFKSFQKFFSFPQKNLGWKIKEEQPILTDEQINNRDFSRRNVVVSAKYLNEKKIEEELQQQESFRKQNVEQEKYRVLDLEKYKKKSDQEQNDPTHPSKKKRLSKRNILEVGIDDKIKEFVQIQEKLKIDEQLSIWGYSFWFSFFCIIVTYGTQFLASEMANSNIHENLIIELQWYLFIFGTSCNTLSLSSIFRNIYFYLIMFWMNITIFVLIRMKRQHEQQVLKKLEEQQKQEQNQNNYQTMNNINNIDAFNQPDQMKDQFRQNMPSNIANISMKHSIGSPHSAAIRAQRSPIHTAQQKQNSQDLDSKSQYNRLTYLHLNPSHISHDQNNELNEQRILFEQIRAERAQEAENEVEVIFKKEGGLMPYKIKWCKIVKNHFRIQNDDSEIEDNYESNTINNDEQDDYDNNNIQSEVVQDQVIQNIYNKYRNERCDTIRETKDSKNEQELQGSSSSYDMEGSIEDEGGINLQADQLGEHKFQIKMTVLNDQYETKKNSSPTRKHNMSILDQLVNEQEKKRRNFEKKQEKQRKLQEQKQKEELRNDCDFIYNNYLRIQYFYEMKNAYVQEKCKSALLLALYPFYSVILMHVSEQKHDIFSYIYLLVAFLGSSVKGINRNTIFLVLLQYMLLLMNINQETSPLKIDSRLLEYKKMSLIQRYITDDKILQYLAFGSNLTNSATISFILNSMVFFIIGFYFQCYKYIVRSIFSNITRVKNRVRQIYEYNLFPQSLNPIVQRSIETKQEDNQISTPPNFSSPDLNINKFKFEKSQTSLSSNPNLSTYSNDLNDKYDTINEGYKTEEIIDPAQPIWINYRNWRSNTFLKANLMYEMSISFGYIFSAVLIMIISCQYLDIFNFIILVYTLVVFFITEFMVSFPKMLNQKKKITNILKILQLYIFATFALYSTMQIPYIRKNISVIGEFLSNQCIEMIIIDKIYIMFCILCTIQLLSSSDFKTITYSVSQSYILSANLSHKAMSMSQNDKVISELLHNEKERRSLRDVVQRVTQTLKNWHKAQQYFSSNNLEKNFHGNNTQSMIQNNQSTKYISRAPTARTTMQPVAPSAFSIQNNNQQQANSDGSSSDTNAYDSNNNLTEKKLRQIPLKKNKSKSMISAHDILPPIINQQNMRRSQKLQHEQVVNESPALKSGNLRRNSAMKQSRNNSKIVLEQVEMTKKDKSDSQNNKQQELLDSNNKLNNMTQSRRSSKGQQLVGNKIPSLNELQNETEKKVQKLIGKKVSSLIELPNDTDKKEENEDLDYSSDEFISNVDEHNKNLDMYVTENPKFFNGGLQLNLNNSMIDQMSQSKVDQSNKNTKGMKIGKVSSIDHLEQTFQFDNQQSPLKKSMNIQKIDVIKSDQNLRKKNKEGTKVNFSQGQRKMSIRKKTFRDEKEVKANIYHNIEKIEATKKTVKDSEDSDTEYDDEEGFYSSDEIDDENNDLMEQIKQEFDKKIQKQKEQEEALKNGGKQLKRETSHKLLIKICKGIESQINPFLFMDSIQMADYILENNCQIFSKIYVNIDDLLLNNFTSIMEYSHLLSIVYYCLYQTIQEAGIEFAFNNLFAIIQRATECDITSRMIYNYLIETSSMYPTIPFYYHIRKEQETNIDDKKILQREQRNNLHHICVYHSQLPIYIYNVKSTNSLPYYLHTKIGLISRIIKSSLKMIISNWHLVCFFFFLIYYFSNSGIMSLPFPAMVFLSFFIEKKFVSLKIWMISFAYVSVLLFFKFIIQVKGIEMDIELQKTFFNDNLNFSYEGYLIFLIFVAQIISKYMGLDKEDIYNSENTHQSYVRKCVNDLEFRQDFIDNCSQEANEQQNKLKQQQNQELSSPNLKKHMLRSRGASRAGTFKNTNSLFLDNQNKFELSEDRTDKSEEQNLESDALKDLNICVFGKQNRGRSDEIDENASPQNIPNQSSNNQESKKQNEGLLIKALKKQSQKQNSKNQLKQNDQFLEDFSIGGGTGTSRQQDLVFQSNQSLYGQNIVQSYQESKINQQSVYEKNQTEKEKSFSMHEQMLKDLRNKPTLLLNQTFKKENFFLRVFNKYNQRPGRDYYPWIALVQVIILLFIFIFYTRIDANNTTGINDQLKYNQFSGEMVICLFIQVAFMVIERYLALRRGQDIDESKQSSDKPSSSSSLSCQDLNDSQNSQDSNQNSEESSNESLIVKQYAKQNSKRQPDQNEQQDDQDRQRKTSSFSSLAQKNLKTFKRSATYKKDKENVNILRSNSKIQEVYESYRNFQEMHSLILNQEDEDDLDHNQKKFNLDKQLRSSDEQPKIQQIPVMKEENVFKLKTEPVQVVNKLPLIQPKPDIKRRRSFTSHTPKNLQKRLSVDNGQIKKGQQIRQVNSVLRDEVLFANLEKDQINANLQIYKQYGNRSNSKNKEDQQMNSSSGDDESLISNSSVFSKSNLQKIDDNLQAQGVDNKQLNINQKGKMIDGKKLIKKSIKKVNKEDNIFNKIDLTKEKSNVDIENQLAEAHKKLENANTYPTENKFSSEKDNKFNLNQDNKQSFENRYSLKLENKYSIDQDNHYSFDKQKGSQLFPDILNDSESFDFPSQNFKLRTSFEEEANNSIIRKGKKEVIIKKKTKQDKFVLTTELLKYIQMVIFTTLFSWFVFFYIPKSFKKNNLEDGSIVVSYKTNGFLTAFVFIVFIYMLLSTLQLRYGYKKLKLRNTILQSKNNLAGFCAIIVRAIPFLQELKVMLDWTVTKTSLTLFQWFLLEDIHYSLYVAKLDSKDARSTKVDEPQPKIIKVLMGLLSVLGILLLIFGPMLLFSTLNPIADYNGITGGQIELGLEFTQNNQINYYPLFQNTHINNLSDVSRDCTYNKNKPTKPAEETQSEEICYWEKYPFKSVNIIYTSDPQQFQKFDLYSYSEKQWDISQPSKADIRSKFSEMINKPESSLKARLVIKLQLNREESQYNSVPYITYYPDKTIINQSNYTSDEYLSQDIIKDLSDSLDDCKKIVTLKDFYIFVFSSTTSRQSYISSPIISKDKTEKIQFVQNAYLQLECFTDEVEKRKETYWKLAIDGGGSDPMKSGLTFFTLTDKYSNATFGFSIITLYTSVILVIGKFIRDAFSGELEKIIIKCMPNPDELLRLCEAISNARNERDLLRERILYFELMDLIRSPEVLKKLTGSYSFVLTQKHKLEIQQEERDMQFKLKQKKLLEKQKNKKLQEEQALKNLQQKDKQTNNKKEQQENQVNQQHYQSNILVNNNYQIEEQIEEEDLEEKTQQIKKK